MFNDAYVKNATLSVFLGFRKKRIIFLRDVVTYSFPRRHPGPAADNYWALTFILIYVATYNYIHILLATHSAFSQKLARFFREAINRPWEIESIRAAAQALLLKAELKCLSSSVQMKMVRLETTR